MSVTYVEGALRIRGPNATKLRKFDDGLNHTLLGPMKAVDFVIDESNYTIFLELKDPDNPKASAPARMEFAQRLKSGNLDEDLKYKFRDSYLYEWARGVASRPILFIVVIQYTPFISAHQMARQD